MKLYLHAAACSLSPHIVCRELGLPIELVKVDRVTHLTADGADYFAINGNGYVPALELDCAFTVADAYLFVVLNWSPFQGLELTRWPVLVEFMGHVGARPKVQEALAAEGLVRHREPAVFYGPPRAIEALAATARA